MKTILTKSGAEVPIIGLGTFPLVGTQLTKVVMDAYKVGYRLFDTSDDYYGEKAIGDAIKNIEEQLDGNREDLFIQTKLSNFDSFQDEPLRGVYYTPNSQFMKRHDITDIVKDQIEESLMNLRTSYIDSVLIHFPYPKFYVDIWKTLINYVEQGVIRYIGVSNFHPRHIENLRRETGILPFANEIYISPMGTKNKQIEYARENDILLMTYSPLMDFVNNRMPKDLFAKLESKYNRTATQIILNWNMRMGSIPLPKTTSIKRLEENFGSKDFTLDEVDVRLICSLNKDYQYLPESLNCPGI